MSEYQQESVITEAPQIGTLLNRLLNQQRLREYFEQPEEERERILGDLFRMPTKVARSEYLADEQEIKNLERGIEETRDLIMRRGVPKTQSPDYQEALEEDFFTPEEAEHHFVLTPNENISASMDTSFRARKPHISHRLSLLYSSAGDFELDLDFNFDGSFDLELGFVNPTTSLIDKRYRSGKCPISEMTKEEAQVAKHYLDKLKADTYKSQSGN